MTQQIDRARTVLGPVEMRIPGEPSLSRVLRLAASGLASMGSFTIDEIDDVKLAVSEVMIALIEHGNGHHVEVVLQVEDGRFTVHGRTAVTSFDADHPDLLLCRTVLESVCAGHGIDVADGTAHIWATVEQLDRT